MDLQHYQNRIRQFANDRDWDQFHSPKNLAMALVGEVGELVELFQWRTEEESRQIDRGSDLHEQLSEELADIMIYMLRLADKGDIDLEMAVQRKMQLNEKRYPIELARGSATKYDQL